jgi:hypothetical protein
MPNPPPIQNQHQAAPSSLAMAALSGKPGAGGSGEQGAFSAFAQRRFDAEMRRFDVLVCLQRLEFRQKTGHDGSDMTIAVSKVVSGCSPEDSS